MKKIFLLAAWCFLSVAVNAKSLVVVLSDGTLVYYLLGSDKNPVMTFNNKTVTVNAGEYTFSDFKKFYISQTDEPSAIESIKSETTSLDGSILYVNAKDKKVAVYATDGKLMDVKPVVDKERTAIPLLGLKSGTYVIQVGKVSFKIYKK